MTNLRVIALSFVCLALILVAISSDFIHQFVQQPSFIEQREHMVATQIENRGIKNKNVLNALLNVKRHLFVPEGLKSKAYQDRPLPIGYDQTISQPYIVAFMTEILDISRDDKILEIGTGSGYQTAVLAELSDHIFTIEIIEPLGSRAKQLLGELGYQNVTARIGDGYKGWVEYAPFDAIIVTCAPDNIPAPLEDQLAEGGKMIIPVGKAGQQRMVLIEKVNGQLIKKAVMRVSFVPMVDEKGDKH